MQELSNSNTVLSNYDVFCKKIEDRVDIQIVKKDGTLEAYDSKKIKDAILKSSERTLTKLTEDEINAICNKVLINLINTNKDEVEVETVHNMVESALEKINKEVADSYRNYRNYKQDFVHMLDKVYQENQRIMYIGDKENSNIDSALVSTKRTLVYNELSKELYKKFFLTKEELQAIKVGYIYIHDMSARLNTMNCFSRSTRFITSQGVRSFEDFCDGDHVFVPTHDGSWHDAVVRNYGKQKLQKVVFKRCSKGTKEVFCTANHRWLLKDGTETTSLKVGDKLILTPDISTIDWDNATMEQKKWWANGFCLGDGYTVKEGRSKGQTTIRLFGYKVEYRNRFEEVGCTVTQPDWMIRSYGVGNAYSVYMGVTFDKNNFSFKDVPFDCLKYLCDGYLCADGHRIRKNSNLSSYFHGVSVSGKNSEFVYDMLNICGYYVTKTIDQTKRVTNYGATNTPSYRYGFYSNQGCRGWVVQAIEPYEEQDVWCLEVEKNHSFILENGIVTGNCCLFDVATVLKDGFEMGNVWYNEPKSLDVAFDVIGDIVMSASAQQYGGFTLPEVDKILEPYAKKSFESYLEKYRNLGVAKDKAYDQALEDIRKDFEQGFQGWEYKFNTVASSRGDYPFITITSGLSTSVLGRICNFAMLETRKNGQGKKENKKPVLFPKIVFLYDKELHSEGKPLHDVYKAGIECSKKTMYPDWLSLTGEGYVPSMYKKYKRVVSPMGCRAFLSPWYEKGGTKPLDETDKPIFVGRFNIGAVSLHLPMILAKARQENKDFYEILDYYLELIRNLHKRTYSYLGEMKASTNPLAYCEGGFYGGHLKYNEKIKPLLKSATASFGITALNELQQLYNKKSIAEDGEFALQVMNYIAEKINEFKEEDGHLYAIYGTPAESLCLCGDEVVQCYNGNKKIKDIKVGDLVYTYNSELKELQLKQVLASTKTKKNAVVVKVTTDNGQEFICTPEHPFGIRKMIQNNDTHRFKCEEVAFVPAKDLKPGMRLKSNYIREDKTTGRVTFSCGNVKQRYQVHGKYLYGEYRPLYEIHHIDHNKHNDNFENLQKLTIKEHRQHHYNLGSYQFTNNNIGEKNHFYGKHHTIESNLANRMAHIKDSVERFSLTGEHLEHFDCMEDAKRKGYVRNLVSLCCKKKYKYGGKTKNIYKDSYWFFTKDCQEMLEANHKVVKVEFLDKLEDVYNIEVADNNNFFIGDNDGVLVHNCGLQVEQFRKKYGIIENVSDRLYVSNSFHCHVTEDLTPIEKQNLENRFWNTMNGGKIQYVRYPIDYNTKAVETLVNRAMDLGFYEGVNLSLAYCDDCGHQELEMDVCPKCGSKNLTKIDRMNGYLSYSRVKGDSRLNDAKMAEIQERKSM